MTKIITIGLTLAIAFAEAGKLKEATFRMALMAAEAQQHEMISLGKLRRMLESVAQVAGSLPPNLLCF